MRQKFFIGAVLTFSLLLGAPALNGHCAPKTPEQFVREFYTWYFKADDKAPADKNDEIYKYLTSRLVEYIRNPYIASDEYYVTKANSWAAGWKDAKIIVGKAIEMVDDVYIMPVTFKVESEDYHVIVFVKKQHDSFIITHVSDIYPYQ